MSSKFKILDKKNIHDGFFKMNEVTLKYKKYNGDWSNEIKRELFGGAQVSAVLPYDPINKKIVLICLLYTSPSPRDMRRSRMPSSA